MKRFILSLVALAFLSCSADAASRFWVGGTGTWDASDTTHWASTSGGAGGASVPGSSDAVTFDGSSGGGTVTVNTNITLSSSVPSFTMGAFTGTIDFATNNNNISAGGFNLSGTGTRTLNMGNGTWTATGTTGQVWTAQTPTNMTLNANSSSIVFNGDSTSTGRQIILGATASFAAGGSYNNVTVSNSSVNTLPIDLNSSGASTIGGTLTFTNVRNVRLPAGATFTVTGAITASGASNSPLFLYASSAATLSVGATNTWDWVFPLNITKAGAGSISITNSYDTGNVSGITITNPSSGGGKIIGG